MRSSIPSALSRLVALTLALALPAFAAPAKHRPDPAEIRAKARFNEANRAYDLGQFEPALEAYSQAYKLKPLPGLLFNIAQCHRQLGNHERAAFFYRRYLDLERKPRDEATVRSLLAEMEAKQRETPRDPAHGLATTGPEAAGSGTPGASRTGRLTDSRAAGATRSGRLMDSVATGATRSGRLDDTSAPMNAHPSADLVSQPPLTQRWYFWTGVGAVVAAGAGILLWATLKPGAPQSTLPDITARVSP